MRCAVGLVQKVHGANRREGNTLHYYVMKYKWAHALYAPHSYLAPNGRVQNSIYNYVIGFQIGSYSHLTRLFAIHRYPVTNDRDYNTKYVCAIMF